MLVVKESSDVVDALMPEPVCHPLSRRRARIAAAEVHVKNPLVVQWRAHWVWRRELSTRGGLCLSVGIVCLCFAANLILVASDRQWEECQFTLFGEADEVETQACLYAKTNNPKDRCKSCLVSTQTYRESSGVLIMTNEFKCMQSSFTIEEGPADARRLCPGRYSVSGCETNDADFQKRVAFIKKVLDEVQQIASDCYVGGIRSELDVCKYNFPKDIQMELAAHLVEGKLVEGQNPATYMKHRVYTCLDLTNFLAKHLVGCDAFKPLGVTSPMSPTFWCHGIDYQPLNGIYHDVAASLEGGTRRKYERRYVRPMHPHNRAT
jgi:hypothetical protein